MIRPHSSKTPRGQEVSRDGTSERPSVRPAAAPPLSVVVLNWNQGEATLACLERILAWRVLQPTVWVVDNASRDDSVERISGRAGVRLLASPANVGFGGGNNLALREIEDELVLLLNSDASVSEEVVISLVESMLAHPDIAVIGPLVKHGRGPRAAVSAGGRDISRHVGTHLPFTDLTGERGSQELRDADYVPGTAALLRAEALVTVGLFDEEYFFSGEMADLCERLRGAGWRCVVEPSMTAEHDLGEAGDLRNTLYAYYSLRNRFLFVRKFRRRALAPLFVFWVAYALFFTARAVLQGRWPTARIGMLALVDGVRGRFGGQNERIAGFRLSPPATP